MVRVLSRRGLFGWSLGGAAFLAHQTLMRADVAWLPEVQRPPADTPLPPAKLAPLLVDRAGNSISTLDGWKARREELREWWLDFLSPLPLQRGAPPQFEVLSEDRVENVIRQRVRYEVEPHKTTEAFLLQPEKCEGRVPAIVAFHSTVPDSIYQPAGLAGPPEKHFGLRFAQLGYVTLCPRNFLWPTNDAIDTAGALAELRSRYPQCTGMAKMLSDALRAVDLLVSLPQVDAGRIGAVGHSLGAKEVLYLSALDERISVTVSSEGGVGTQHSNWNAPWYLGDRINPSSFEHEHHELLALCAPRPFLLIGGDSADGDKSWPFVAAALDVYRLYPGSPRLGLYNHKQGHSVPPTAALRIEQWFREYLPT
jgi:dienelactone hydrolase